MLAFSAAGFIATSTLGVSPGVRMSRLAKWIWKALTPPTVPAGARISAGKSGSVARSLPSIAVASVKRVPASCMPSPESPAKRTMTRSRSSTVFDFLGELSRATGRLLTVAIYNWGGSSNWASPAVTMTGSPARAARLNGVWERV